MVSGEVRAVPEIAGEGKELVIAMLGSISGG
jgi:hypothetical protein